MKDYQRVGVLLTAILIFSTLLASSFLFQKPTRVVSTLPYSQFLAKVEKNEIQEALIKTNELLAIPKVTAVTVPGADKQPQPAQLGKPAPNAADKKQPNTPPAALPAKPEGTSDTLFPPLGGGLKRTPAQQPTGPSASQGTQQDGAGSLLPSLKVAATVPLQQYRVALPPQGVPESLIGTLEQHGVRFSFEQQQSNNRWWSVVWSLLLPLIIFFFLIALFRNIQSGGGQALSFGKSRAKLMMESNIKIRFDDVAGVDEPKKELEEVVDFLKDGEKYQRLGAKIPKGVLLVGPPGTGKTLLAKAVAGEAGRPFFSISGSDFVEMFVGVGASRVRDLFEQAKKHAPCIVFVDEIDAVGRQRGAGLGGGHDEREQTLNQLLVEMDGFEPNLGIVVIAATNRPDILDRALLRPGRFDRQVVLDHPDVRGREQILRVHAKNKKLAGDVDLKRLAKATPGFTGADLANLLNEGALLAARKNQDLVHLVDIEDAIDKVYAGVERKSKLMSRKDKDLVAYHELGHTLVAWFTKEADPVRKVTIIPRGMALGLTWTMPDDATLNSYNHLLAEIAVSLGGRVAEEIIYGPTMITTGASNDLQRVSSVARKIVTVYGMTDALGPITYGERNEHMFMGRDFGTERNYSEEVAAEIDRQVRQIVDGQYVYVRDLLSRHRGLMENLAAELLEKETMDDQELNRFILNYYGDQPIDEINPAQLELLTSNSETNEEGVVHGPDQGPDAPGGDDLPPGSGGGGQDMFVRTQTPSPRPTGNGSGNQLMVSTPQEDRYPTVVSRAAHGGPLSQRSLWRAVAAESRRTPEAWLYPSDTLL